MSNGRTDLRVTNHGSSLGPVAPYAAATSAKAPISASKGSPS
jgi:hypothetical protein